jgi:hypothetical protein
MNAAGLAQSGGAIAPGASQAIIEATARVVESGQHRLRELARAQFKELQKFAGGVESHLRLLGRSRCCRAAIQSRWTRRAEKFCATRLMVKAGQKLKTRLDAGEIFSEVQKTRQ